jgi:hypothetical protein
VNALQPDAGRVRQKELLSMPSRDNATLPPRPGDASGAAEPVTKFPSLMIRSPKVSSNSTSSALGCPMNRFDKARVTKCAAIATLPSVKVRAR